MEPVGAWAETAEVAYLELAEGLVCRLLAGNELERQRGTMGGLAGAPRPFEEWVE